MSGFDRDAAEAVDGVIAVVTGPENSVGLIASTPMALACGMTALNVQWAALEESELAGLQHSLDIDSAIAEGLLDHTEKVAGSLRDGEAFATRRVSQRYDTPMTAHAAMEPRSGVAWCQDDGRCELWTGSQDAWIVRTIVARTLNLSKDSIVVHNCRIGGAFGGRLLCQASIEAAWLSKAVNQPVKVQWSREDEFRHNYAGPPFSTRIEAGIDDDGQITHWHHQLVSAPVLTSSMFIPKYLHWAANFPKDPGTARGTQLPYRVANHRIDIGDVRLPMPTGPWRGLGAAPNTFAVECAMDELAHSANKDPLEFRLQHSGSERLTQALLRLQKLISSEVSSESLRPGIAATVYKGVTYVAVAAAVEMNGDTPKVVKLWCVHDCGRIISPDRVRAQIEGNLAWGISMALHENYALQDGIAHTDNFDTYPIVRNSLVPDMSIELVDSQDAASGAGEAAFTPVAAAIVNGVFNVSGARFRKLPIGSS